MTGILGTTKQGQEIACWVMKCNPAVFNIAEDVAATGEVGNWSVRETYRLDLMEPGQPCLLWVTGGKDSPVPAGFYAAGVLGAAPDGGVLVLDRYAEGVRPNDQQGADAVRTFAVCNLSWLATPVTKAELLSAYPEFESAEMLRSPQGASPAILTPEQYRAVTDFDLSPGPVTDEQLEAFGRLDPHGDQFFVMVHRPDGRTILSVEHPNEIQIVEIDIEAGERVGERGEFPNWATALRHVAETIESVGEAYPLPDQDGMADPIVRWTGSSGDVFLYRVAEDEWIERTLKDGADVEDPQLFSSLEDYLGYLGEQW